MIRHIVIAGLLAFTTTVFAQSPDALIANGDAAFSRGEFARAAEFWESGLAQFDESTPATTRIDTLTRLARAYQTLGQHLRVFPLLDDALTLIEQTDDTRRSALALSQLSDSWLSIGDAEEALRLAEDAVAQAKTTDDKQLQATTLLSEGNALAVLWYIPESIEAFQEAVNAADAADDKTLALSAAVNYTDAALSDGAISVAKEGLEQLTRRINGISDAFIKADSLISAGLLAHRLWLNEQEFAEKPDTWALNYAADAYKQAVQLSGNNARLKSIAYGHWAELYASESARTEAMTLSRQAIFYASQTNAPEILYRWQWLQGRLLRAQVRNEEAIKLYRQATATLNPIQQRIDLGYRSPPGEFDEIVRPVYYELADLLLEKASKTNDPEQRKQLYKEARETVEQVKVAELQNYFRDECVQAAQSRATTSLEEVDPKTAILYPIPLEDRLALLVSIKGEITYVSVDVGNEELGATAWDLRLGLQTRPNNRFLLYAQQMYDWLIRPTAEALKAGDVDTVVVIPDGKLRMLPFAALHDGEQFLIEQYAVVTTPGLSVTDPRAIDWQGDDVLLVGLSDGVQGYSPLPNVPKELSTIQKITGGEQILNQSFSIDNLRSQLQQSPFTVVHMATHGEFDSHPDNTYLLTYEEKIKMDDLQQIIGLGNLRDQPIELLTLSACKTAVGDDKAALGLAGVAVKAGARSALASLWFVDDEATSLTVTEFYRQLRSGQGLSKAKALQNAQLSLLQQARFRHPAYWAPFLLIGNWL